MRPRRGKLFERYRREALLMVERKAAVDALLGHADPDYDPREPDGIRCRGAMPWAWEHGRARTTGPRHPNLIPEEPGRGFAYGFLEDGAYLDAWQLGVDTFLKIRRRATPCPEPLPEGVDFL